MALRSTGTGRISNGLGCLKKRQRFGKRTDIPGAYTFSTLERGKANEEKSIMDNRGMYHTNQYMGYQGNLFVQQSRSNENTEESHRSLPVYAINPKSRFGQAARYDKEMKDWWEATNEVNLWLHNDLKAPMDVSSTVEIMDGTAKITYQGTATSLENENVEIYKEVVIDFPVSANLEIEKTE